MAGGKGYWEKQQYGNRADHQAKSEQWSTQAKNSHGWGDPRDLAGLEERACGVAGPDVQMPQDGQRWEKSVTGSWSKATILWGSLANYLEEI